MRSGQLVAREPGGLAPGRVGVRYGLADPAYSKAGRGPVNRRRLQAGGRRGGGETRLCVHVTERGPG
jgi:hypothetical protein